MSGPLDLDAPADELDSRPFAEINVTPFVDVMLVLLVVFMMAAPLLVRGVPVDLPTSLGRPLGRPTTPLIVSLARDGGLSLHDESIAPADLVARLRAASAGDPAPLVYLRADRGIPYGAVMDVIGRLGTGGFAHVSLLSQPGGTGTAP